MKILTDLTPTPETQEIIYNSLDTMQTMALKEAYDAGLLPDWAKITYTYSEKMLGPILTMMRRGVRIDLAKRDEIVKNLETRLASVRRTFDTICERLFDTTINFNSPQQLQNLFYVFLGIPEQTKNKKGEIKVATDREVLERIARDYPRGAVFANLILRLRELEKQIEFLTKSLSPEGRFHTSYNIAGTETFRLSSSEHPLRIGCVPDDAEALTPNGWVPIKAQPPFIMQWEPDGSLNFSQAVWNFYEYSGSLLSYFGRCVRGAFTPEHRTPYYNAQGNFHVDSASAVSAISAVSTPVTGYYAPGIAVDEQWICKLVGEGVSKKFPDITKWDLQSRQIFFDELKHSDAHIQGNNYIYYTFIPENADIVMTAAHMTGLSASIFIDNANSNKHGNTFAGSLYSVNISSEATNKLEKKRWTSEQFSGVVGCPTVASGFWLVRYRGGIYVTGNSNQQNIPGEARICFVPDPGYLFFQADQQGAEARLVAYKTGDENYIAACEGGDSHTMVAAMVFGFEPDREIAEREYRRGKSYRQTAKSGAHGCLTGEHEVLTPTGWVRIDTKPNVIAQWSPQNGGTITWAPVSNWLVKTATSLVSIEGPSISFLGTEDHKILVANAGRWIERTAGTLKKSDRIPYTGMWEGGHIHEPAVARVVAAYQADGSYVPGKNIHFKFRRAHKITRLRELLSDANISYTESRQGKDTCFLLDASSSSLIAAYGKTATAALLRWDNATLTAFVDETVYWNGTIGKSNRRAVCSVNLEHCRNLQTLYQFAGYGSKVIDNTGKTKTNAFGKQRPNWVSINSRKFASVSSCKISTKQISAQVYCPTVETGYFMVRRNGHIYVTGNSNYMGKPYTLAKQMGVDVETAEHFQANYFKKFPGIPKWHAWTAKQIQTLGYLDNPFGMRRTFWGRRWDDATLREAIAFYPQSAVGVLTNIVLYKLWLKYEGQPGAPVQILMNGHDAVIGQIREDLAEELIPELLAEMRFPFEVTDIHGKVRTVEIPFDMEVGRNWAKYDPNTNPEGLKKWKPKA